ncbi:MAG: hypothetical protein NTZ74_16225 [Chloroflexi bacterium]|nr:hypothetical protein [Chloroflexota bacterium]
MKKTLITPLLFLGTFILIIGAACSFSIGGDKTATVEPLVVVITATPIPKVELPTQEIIAAPTEVFTEVPTDTPAPTDFFVEEFDGNMDNYTYFVNNGDESKMDLRHEEGQLKFDLNGAYLWPYVLYEPYIYTDVRIDTEAENIGSNNNSVTLVCRYDEKLGWYEFNIANDGTWYIAYYDNIIKKGYTTLYDGGSTAIRMGRNTNTYTAICQGNQLTLMINGVLTRTIQNNDLKEGQVGIGISSYANYPVIVNFNWMEISQP